MMLIFASESEILQWSNVDEIEYEINKISKKCKEAGTPKWVLKFPYMTNCENRFWCKDQSTLMKRILQSNVADDIGMSVPYGLIQPWSTNGKEYKVIVLDGKSAFCTVRNSGSKPVAFGDEETLFRFAEESLRLLKYYRPGTISDGLVRVDIMQRNDGVMIVNEFEGFEAGFEKSAATQGLVGTCLTNFWANKLQHVYECSQRS